jgi:hypothetical protein
LDEVHRRSEINEYTRQIPKWLRTNVESTAMRFTDCLDSSNFSDVLLHILNRSSNVECGQCREDLNCEAWSLALRPTWSDEHILH